MFIIGSTVTATTRRQGVETRYTGTVASIKSGPKGDFVVVKLAGSDKLKSVRPANVVVESVATRKAKKAA